MSEIKELGQVCNMAIRVRVSAPKAFKKMSQNVPLRAFGLESAVLIVFSRILQKTVTFPFPGVGIKGNWIRLFHTVQSREVSFHS